MTERRDGVIVFVMRASGRAAHLRAGTWREVTPEAAGWRYLSFRLLALGPGERAMVGGGADELGIVLLAGSVRVGGPGETWRMTRTSVFEEPPWAVYLPAGAAATVEAEAPAELAVVGARADRRGEARLIAPADVEVEVRGAGSATRQINHVIPPAFPAHRLLVVEVLTPAGNWSSYPPHKHDRDRPPAEVALEEFYYFRVRPPHGFAFQRVYSPEREVDLTVAVGDGDVVLVPYGYHVSAAPHGFDLYYLNGLAGDTRSMAASDDPSLAYIRATWSGMPKDPRVPMAAGPRGGTDA
ncbi:MAG TPA: 5-deoxy-glucuronate isomerase [Actinomycetota bacterium]|nr:5-deoxy-glucuronate isomerase [Actinomycetota bacterium]